MIKQEVKDVMVFYNTELKEFSASLSDTISDHKTKDWINNLIKTFEYALDDSNNFPCEGSVYNDLLYTLELLYQWMVKGNEYVSVELYNKYRTVFTAGEIGKAMKVLCDRMAERKGKNRN